MEIENEQIQLEQTESLEWELTAKGQYKWVGKLRAKELGEKELDRIRVLDDKMRMMFPNNTMVRI